MARGLFDVQFASRESVFDPQMRRAAWFDDGVLESLHTQAYSDVLPANDGDLNTAYNAADISAVALDDATRQITSGSTAGYLIAQFKVTNANSTDAINVSWNGQVQVAPTTSAVFLQIYNRTTSTWETLVSNNTAAANTDFTLTALQASSLSDYYDSNYVVSLRVYQTKILG